MFLALVGLVLAVALAGHGWARLDEDRLRMLRREKMLELGWV